MEPLALVVPGGTVSGTFWPVGGTSAADFAVVWVHGFGSFRGGEKAAALRAECAARGWAFLSFDFRGHGRSSGNMHELRASGLLEDLQAVRNFLAHRGRTRLGLVGSSMGGFASSWFTLAHAGSVTGCVFLAPAFGFLQRRWDRLTPEQREQWRLTDRLTFKNEWVETELGYGLVEERDRFRPNDLAAAWGKPLLIFHGLADDIVPVEDSLDFVRAAKYPGIELRVFKDGDHRLTAYKDEIAAETCRFFARLTSSPTPPGAHP
ncbi:alpha/beta hydrolase [Gemmata sp.]|uniref:alpha/beta hydrolase n=1 Tax=Gemmata sp. TaxID=1914242 RepID=UPI003F703064